MQKDDFTYAKGKMLIAALRFCIIAVCISAFIPALNPAQLTVLVNRNSSLFTNAISYSSVASSSVSIRALLEGWVEQSTLTTLYAGALVSGLAVLLLGAAFCVSLGNLKMQRLGLIFSFCAILIGVTGITVLRLTYNMLAASPVPERIEAVLPLGIPFYYTLFALILLFVVAAWIKLPKPAVGESYEIAPKYRLLLMFMPFLVLVLLFAYLPLWGWRYAFFDYRPGFELSMDDWVGLKWLRYLFDNPATRNDITRVLKNTLAMSGLGLATAWLPMAFAIFLSEIRINKFKRGVQTLTTIPNFISWVLVYSVAFAIFSTEGFLNWLLISLGIIESGTNYLMSGSNIWVKMWLWGTWKGLGWGAIIYIAAISGIDQQLYEAATVDGAGRFKRMWYVTVPGLMSTFFVLLLLGIAGVLSNGMDQYLVFYNPRNRETIEVLDLYVYHLALAQGDNIPLATLLGMSKSLISVLLLMVANRASKFLRGESIV